MTDLVRVARARLLAESGDAERIRKAAHISLAEMGRAVGVPKSTVFYWESGEKTPTDPKALAWLDVIEALQTVLDGPTDTGTVGAYPKDAGEFAARWNAKTVEERDELVRRLQFYTERSLRCTLNDHDAEIDRLRTELLDHTFPKEEAHA